MKRGKNKSWNRKLQLIIWTIAGIIFMGVFIVAGGTISEYGIITTGNISAGNGSFYVNSTGIAVGIGTMNPSMELDVRGRGNFSGEVYYNNQTPISAINTTASFVYGINTTKNIGNLYNLTSSIISNLSFNQKANISIQQYVNMINTTAVHQMLLNGTNVWFASIGIGTASPAYLLEIANSATALNVSGNLYANSTTISVTNGTLELNNNATISRSGVGTKMWIDENGNINVQFGTAT